MTTQEQEGRMFGHQLLQEKRKRRVFACGFTSNITVAFCVSIFAFGMSCSDSVNDNNASDVRGSQSSAPQSCGNGVLESGEACDNGSQNSDTLPDRCRTDCNVAKCGDNILDEGESCDGGLGSGTCNTLGFTAGDLSCSPTCTFDTSLCRGCGDDKAEETEECDGTDLRAKDCVTQGFLWGALKCSNCVLDTSECSAEPAVCLNNIAEDMEVCDGDDLLTQTCVSLGFTGGDLGCLGDCTDFDPANCYTCGNGVIEPGEICDDGNTLADFTCSSNCQYACEPGFAECTVEGSSFCAVDSQGVATIGAEICDIVQGVSCDAQTQRCEGACSRKALGKSYIGCEYYPTITYNSHLSDVFSFAVTISNSGSSAANITITLGTANVTTATVLPGDVKAIKLPPTSYLTRAFTTLEPDAAYHLRSDQPVTVYQFNPLDFELSINGSHNWSYSNDASLLFPTNTWTGSYMVVSRKQVASIISSGFYTVTAKEDNTSVTLSPSPTAREIDPFNSILPSDGAGTVMMNSGDVMHVTTTSFHRSESDLTGTFVSADKNIQVIGGHDCIKIPEDNPACDHLEESMHPLKTVGKSYIVTQPVQWADESGALALGAPRMVRIVATEANTTLVYEPPQIGAPTTITKAGGYIEIAGTNETFQISGDKKIMVAQYMMGSRIAGRGDPSMVLAVPIEQYRKHYLFHAPTNYDGNYVNLTAPTGSLVSLDDGTSTINITEWTTIGTTGYDFARIGLSNTGNGNYNVSSTNAFGISVYGYGSYTSYWYPGGLDLKEIKK